MKKLLLLPFLVFCVGCSVDNEDLLVPENEMHTLDLQNNFLSEAAAMTTEEEFCGTATYAFSEYGDLQIKHDGFKVYVSITAREGYDLLDTKLHLGSGETAFPTVGQGNLPPGQMGHRYSFGPGTDSYTFPPFDIADDLWGRFLSIASKTTFTDGTNSFSSWTGPIKGNSGNWSYLNYQIKTCCEIAEAGDGIPNTKEITQAFYDSNIGTAFWLRRYILNNLLDAGVVKSGAFSPTAGYLDQMYNDWTGKGGHDANLPIETDEGGRLIMRTTYSVGQGNCLDTEEIVLYIAPTISGS